MFDGRNYNLPPVVTDFVQSVPNYEYFVHPDSLQAHFASLQGRTEFAEAEFVTLRDDYGQLFHPFVVRRHHADDRSNGKKAYFKIGVHSDELAGRNTAKHTSGCAMNTRLLEYLGLEEMIFFDSDQDGAAMNRLFDRSLTMEASLGGGYRNPQQPDWAYPYKSNKHTFNPDQEIHRGALGSAKIIEKLRPDAMMPDHCHFLLDGTYWYASRDNPELFFAFYELARLINMPVSDVPEMQYVRKIQHGIYYPITASLLLEYGDLPLDVGEASAGYLAQIAPEALHVINETPPFLATKQEAAPGRIAVFKAVKRMERLVKVGASVLDAHKEVSLEGTARAYYQSLQIRSGWWQRVLGGEATSFDENVLARGPAIELFRVARHLGDALQLATLTGDEASSRTVSKAINKSARTVSKALQPRTLPIRDIVRMQAGTLALASLAQSGRL